MGYYFGGLFDRFDKFLQILSQNNNGARSCYKQLHDVRLVVSVPFSTNLAFTSRGVGKLERLLTALEDVVHSPSTLHDTHQKDTRTHVTNLQSRVVTMAEDEPRTWHNPNQWGKERWIVFKMIFEWGLNGSNGFLGEHGAIECGQKHHREGLNDQFVQEICESFDEPVSFANILY